MLVHRPAHERGHIDRGWLDSRFSFSFAEYHDPHHMGFHSLRVLNDDIIQPGTGFGTHPHQDMEIISYISHGRLIHHDSTGGAETLGPGEIQVMHAGTGIHHSEHAAEDVDHTRMLQIWIIPQRKGVTPGYEQKAFPFQEERDRWHHIVAPVGQTRSGQIGIHADAHLAVGHFDAGAAIPLPVQADRHHWLQVVNGRLEVDHLDLRAGDGLAVSDRDALDGRTSEGAELLFFTLA